MERPEIIIKYLDLFGTRCTFYSEKMPKLYTITGGIFSIFSILACILIFIILSLDDLKRKFPNTTTSSIPSEGYRKIKFSKEKIWIPWRIVDYNNNEFVNHTGLLYPIISYYSGEKNKSSKDFNLTKKLLSYKLCSETPMAYENDIYQISVPLNELYCINMEDLDMGGSWITQFIYYIKFEVYYCQDGINYNETNSKCTSFEKIINFIGKNNSLEIDIYYPIVQFQPTNKTYPLIVIYRNHFYHISKYVNKIDRIFLQENVLTDDEGWILKKESNFSCWGLDTISGDTYFIGKENDLMNEGSNSRAYSFNLYLEPGIIHYKRYYKKLYTIFSDFFPIAYVIFVIMKNIAKLFKKAENNRKMIELLFENLKEKPNIFERNIQKLRIRNYNSINNNIRSSFSSLNNKKNFNTFKKEEVNVDKQNISNKSNIHHSLILNKSSFIKKNFNNNRSNNNSKIGSSKFYQKHRKSSNNASEQNLIIIEHNGSNEDEKNNKNNEIMNQIKKPQKNFVKEKLFPYKYYLFSVFIKNLNTSNNNCLFSSRFVKIYTFYCQLFDITTYLSLQREFNALKTIFNEKSVNLIEKNQKINVNSSTFIKDINNCIGEHKFYILAQGINKKYN